MTTIDDHDTRTEGRSAGSSRERTARRLAAAAGGLVVAAGVVRLVAIGDVEVTLPFMAVGAALAVAAWMGRWRTTGALGVLVAVALVVSPAAPELAFNLARPEQVGWFVWSLVLVAAGGLVAAALTLRRTPAGRHGVFTATCAAVAVSAATIAGIAVVGDTTVLRAPAEMALPEIPLFERGFGELRFAEDADGTRWAVVVNDTSVPHTFTVASLGVDVYVPAGRDAVVRVPAADGPVTLVCTIGDHADQGMVASLD